MELLKFLEGSGDIGLAILALFMMHKQGIAKLESLTKSVNDCTTSVNKCTLTLTEHAVKLETGADRMDKIESEIEIQRQHTHRIGSLVQQHEAKLKDR